MNQKIKGYLNLSRKANALVIGSDNLEKSKKRLHLIIESSDISESVEKLGTNISQKKNCKIVKLEVKLAEIIGINKCQIVGITDQGLANEIIRILNRGE